MFISPTDPPRRRGHTQLQEPPANSILFRESNSNTPKPMTDDPHTDPQDGVPAGPVPPSGAPPRQSTGGTVRWTPPSPERLQRMLPQYEVLEMIGHGGMAAVYQARQISLDRVVAIKILPPEAADDELDFIARFKNEARTMAKMLHPAIVAVFDFGETPEGQLFIVMEYVDGTDVPK